MIVASAKAVRLEDEIARRGVALKRQGRELVGPCLVCGGEDRFGVNLQKQIWNCRGCGKGGDVIALVQHVDGASFRAAVETLTGSAERPPARTNNSNGKPKAATDDVHIKAWWSEARPVAGTLAEKYCAARGITQLPPDADEALRFHPSIVFGTAAGGATRYVPALIALVRDVLTGKPIGLQRVGLTPDGHKLDRMALGHIGGGAVMLWPPEEISAGLALAEGVETALAASALEYRGTLLRPIWATVSAGTMGAFPVLAGIDALTLIVDADAPDQRGQRRGQDEAAKCAERWQAAGVEVTRLLPNNNQQAGAA
jgi:phage/plasmid primase-like uncharacterized protein